MHVKLTARTAAACTQRSTCSLTHLLPVVGKTTFPAGLPGACGPPDGAELVPAVLPVQARAAHSVCRTAPCPLRQVEPVPEQHLGVAGQLTCRLPWRRRGWSSGGYAASVKAPARAHEGLAACLPLSAKLGGRHSGTPEIIQAELLLPSLCCVPPSAACTASWARAGASRGCAETCLELRLLRLSLRLRRRCRCCCCCRGGGGAVAALGWRLLPRGLHIVQGRRKVHLAVGLDH